MRITNTTHYKHNAKNKIIQKETKSYSLTFLPLHKYTQTLKNRITHITTILKQNTLTNITLLAYKQGPDKYSGWFRISATKEQYRTNHRGLHQRSKTTTHQNTALKMKQTPEISVIVPTISLNSIHELLGLILSDARERFKNPPKNQKHENNITQHYKTIKPIKHTTNHNKTKLPTNKTLYVKTY